MKIEKFNSYKTNENTHIKEEVFEVNKSVIIDMIVNKMKSNDNYQVKVENAIDGLTEYSNFDEIKNYLSDFDDSKLENLFLDILEY